MKASPFADLKLSAPLDSAPKGPDQRLFAPPQPEGPRAAEPEASALPRTRANGSPHEGTRAHLHERAPEQSGARANGAALESTHARSVARVTGRHSHDLFQDQIRWMNHLKLELTERSGEPITGNAMVQLAVDMLREDYVRNGENSQLIRVLMHGRSPLARQEVEGEGGR